MYDHILWFSIFVTLQIGCFKVLPPVYKKKWPLSAYVVSLLYQLVITPWLWWRNESAQTCLICGIGYFSSDLFLNYKYFDKWLLAHHISSILLTHGSIYFPPKTMKAAAAWLMLLEFGSAGINITTLTNRFYNVRLVLYGFTRLIVTLHMFYIFATTEDQTTKIVLTMTFPLIGINLHIFMTMLRRYRRKKYL